MRQFAKNPNLEEILEDEIFFEQFVREIRDLHNKSEREIREYFQNHLKIKNYSSNFTVSEIQDLCRASNIDPEDLVDIDVGRVDVSWS